MRHFWTPPKCFAYNAICPFHNAKQTFILEIIQNWMKSLRVMRLECYIGKKINPMHCHNSDDLFNTFHSTISDIYILSQISLFENYHENNSTRRKNAGWHLNGIGTAIKEKNGLFKNLIRTCTRSNEVLTKLKSYRNKLNHLTKVFIRNYYYNYNLLIQITKIMQRDMARY
jgi:hypothetical protein